MNFIEAVKEYFKRYADFNGRSRRSAFWWVVLFNIIVGFILSFIDVNILGQGQQTITTENGFSFTRSLGILGGIYSLATLIPSIANSVRRLHDTGKSGWMLLLIFLPIIGWIWLIVLYATDSQPGDNEYGPNPKTGINEDDLNNFGKQDV